METVTFRPACLSHRFVSSSKGIVHSPLYPSFPFRRLPSEAHRRRMQNTNDMWYLNGRDICAIQTGASLAGVVPVTNTCKLPVQKMCYCHLWSSKHCSSMQSSSLVFCKPPIQNLSNWTIKDFVSAMKHKYPSVQIKNCFKIIFFYYIPFEELLRVLICAIAITRSINWNWHLYYL